MVNHVALALFNVVLGIVIPGVVGDFFLKIAGFIIVILLLRAVKS